MKTKVCKRCRQTLPITEFYQVFSMKEGFDNTCKNCRREMKLGIRTPDNLYCPVCNRDLPYYKFIIARKSHTGRMWCCKECFDNKSNISDNNFRKNFDIEFKKLIYSQKENPELEILFMLCGKLLSPEQRKKNLNLILKNLI